MTTRRIGVYPTEWKQPFRFTWNGKTWRHPITPRGLAPAFPAFPGLTRNGPRCRALNEHLWAAATRITETTLWFD